jgi:5-(aminomethyl)-3-furanmethanol phosphate kinase
MVILKLGGSLLTLPDLAARIEAIVAQRCSEQITIVVGGGAPADLVREWDRIHSLGDEAAHQLALTAMRLTAEFLAQRLPTACIVENIDALTAAWAAGKLPLIAADAWLAQAEASGRDTIPHTWDATSDSIAAWLATELAAKELILLKSVDCPQVDAQQAVHDGVVDRCFPAAAARIPRVSWVNLRSADCRIKLWRLAP